MRRLLVLVLMLGLAGAASAAQLGTTLDLTGKGQWLGDGAVDGREGGETVPTAVVITGLPFSDTGATCDNIHDYDEVCPYSGSLAPDVVYVYTPSADIAVSIDLCASSYDTKVYVYANAVGNLVACNDDAGCGYSGWQSLIDNLTLTAGINYYIVVDGYGSACGTYDIQVAGFEPCVVECPAGGVPEGEPPCVDGYYDAYNGGCNSVGWTEILAAEGSDCGTICGKSCTYLYQGSSYRDTDWFLTTALAAGQMAGTCEAEFPLQFILIYVPDCNNLQYTLLQGGPCSPLSLSWGVSANQIIWWWVGASVFSGIPESDYVLTVCNITGGGPVPTEETSWGAIKNLYK